MTYHDKSLCNIMVTKGFLIHCANAQSGRYDSTRCEFTIIVLWELSEGLRKLTQVAGRNVDEHADLPMLDRS